MGLNTNAVIAATDASGIVKLRVGSVDAMLAQGAILRPKQHGIYVFDGRIAATHTPDGTSGTTYSAVFTLAEVPDAVEPIFANGGTSTYTISAMSAASVSEGDMNGASSTLTVGDITGADTVPARAGTAQPGLLTGNKMLLNNPSASNMVMIRAYLPNTSGSVTMLGNGASGASDSFTNWATRTGSVVSFRQQTDNKTATAGAFTSTTQISYSPIIGCKFYCRGRVLTVMVSGDSIDSGRGTYLCDTPVRQAINLLTRRGYSVSVANLAWAGAASANNRNTPGIAFAAGLVPDMLVRSAASPNDTSGAITDSSTVTVWRQSVGEVLAACAAYDVDCAFRTGIPANHAGDTPAGGESWGATDSLMQGWNTEVLSWRSRGVRVFDWWTPVAGSVGPGGNVAFASGATTDGTHPSMSGNTLIAAAMAATGYLP